MYKVMIVDDEQSIKRSLEAIIKASGLPFQTVGYAMDGREALELAQRCEPHVVFTDIRMPGMDGLTLAGELTASRNRPCVVIISGHEQFDYAQQAMRFGVIDYLLKPVSAKQVHAILARLAAEWDRGRVKLTEKRDWSVKNSERVRELSEQLWQLDTEEAMQVAQRMQEAFRREAYSEYTVTDMLEDLLSGVIVQLADRHDKQFELPQNVSAMSTGERSFAEAAREAFAGIARQIGQSRNWSYRGQIRKAIAFMQANYTNPDLAINDVAGQLGMTATYFSKCFKEEVGTNYSRYLLQLRMDQAVHLLGQPNTKISEIAHNVGYREYTHFSKIFKKLYGCTPSEYRDRYC